MKNWRHISNLATTIELAERLRENNMAISLNYNGGSDIRNMPGWLHLSPEVMREVMELIDRRSQELLQKELAQ